MAINGIELEVGQRWLTRGGVTVEVVKGPSNALWRFIVRRDAEVLYSVGLDGFAMSSDNPRDTDLVQPVELGIDLPLQATAEPQDSNAVTSAQVNDWIDWHGGECPVGPSTPVEMRLRGGKVLETYQPGEMHWEHGWLGGGADIVAYRVVKPTLFHERVRVDGERPGPLQRMVLEAMSGVGDINSDAKGSGARFNTGKPTLELIPLSIIVPYFHNDDTLTDAQQRALRALDALGMFQAREGGVYEVLRELGDHWDGCAAVFEMTPEFSDWKWTKGLKWSVPIGRAARHLMAIIRGETTNPESCLSHVAHVYCNVVMLLTYAGTFTQGDDRPTKGMLL